ncbi:major head protein [Pseudomonas phage tf]|uniref:Major head protein n=1 Tax=Pseudomonas phage tf TaxID=1114179 RepID=I2FLT5_9CAUD|nr:major head protein [Pseudomonas phage tf]CCE60819.1 major head protein [Pseudomonas phage tf]
MAVVTNTVLTPSLKGQREDLIDMIYNIDPYDTPMLSSIGKGTAKALRHDWQTDELRSPAINQRLEGDEATIKAGSFTEVLDNICQISDETLAVSGTSDAINKAGRKSELAYQLAKKSKEIKLDIEHMLVGVGLVKRQRTSNVAPSMGNFYSYYKTNGSGYTTAPTGNGVDLGTVGTARVLTESIIQDAAQKIWENGGNANTIMVNGPMKQLISNTFKGRAGGTDGRININASDRKVQSVVDFYESDFGAYKVVANRWMKASAAFMYDPSMHSLLYLRAFKQYPLAKTGDSEKRQMLCEYTLRVNNEKSGALIEGLKLS